MQVLLSMLKRTSADDGQALLDPAVKDLSETLLIAGAKQMPSIKMICTIVRSCKNIPETVKPKIISWFRGQNFMEMRGSEPREAKSRVQIVAQDSQRIARDMATPAQTFSQEVSVKYSKLQLLEIQLVTTARWVKP